jgi:hypothetical protein
MQKRDFIAEETSFWELLQKLKIEIPIIQRDYAQGRIGEEKVRQRFLRALYDTIISSATLELDFIYGSKESGSLQPLDGQQRLTTLFLLHWYAACKDGILMNLEAVFKNFTYETRFSSRTFCEKLSLNQLNFGELLPADDGEENRVSNTITDASWFFLAWRKDPTISAMLNMLNDIDAIFKDVPALWQKLTGSRSISFQYVELKNFGLSDDLYIKMNARGKALTAFENFKARLERHINQPTWEQSGTAKFAENLDTTWTDLFWGRVNNPEDIDTAFIKYFAGAAINLYAQDGKIAASTADLERKRIELQKRTKGKITDEAITRALLEERIEVLFNQPTELDPSDFQQPADLEYLAAGLTQYAKIYKYKQGIDLENLNLWDFTAADTDIFHECSRPKGQTTYKQRVLFYAQTAFLLKNENTDEALHNWMRVIRNIVEQATIDSAGTFIGAIGLIHELSAGCIDIYAYLADNKVRSNFAEKQVSEECWKAELIRKFDLSSNTFHAMEDTNFCRGRIMFGLYCMEIHEESTSAHLDRLDGLTRVFSTYLSGSDVTNAFRRALLSMGDNRFYIYWWSWSYNTNTNKRCLIEDMNGPNGLKSFAYRHDFRHYLRSLMLGLLTKTPEQIADDFSPNENILPWITILIKDENVLNKHGKSKYFGLTPDEKRCYLYNEWKRPGSLKDCFEIK